MFAIAFHKSSILTRQVFNPVPFGLPVLKLFPTFDLHPSSACLNFPLILATGCCAAFEPSDRPGRRGRYPNPRQKGPRRCQGGLASHCATDAPAGLKTLCHSYYVLLNNKKQEWPRGSRSNGQ
ncbi:hypothetical protein PoB_000578800 [Plakobranchus ocellatus]|uniref:Uncharacterized protein n=1 Tax=Plakobranchus ocellatus TaxID=259542 RepID=A0AAV3YAW1_9GAST|nr:hypothetical protein PoB_000578800 [Plakobranchus ocellatus]